ncbi:uncharacterized protein [Parasteatoda tepidariorum]|uniref:uncharacterized protein n=1 Tax=Parasteatoda tepidariorum TaxID=114398 RepID=UPI001C72493D|nr:uncharacterized protein LOC107440628 [Parasteatoda tepidariorum]
MKWLTGIVLCLFVGLAACDFACFNNTIGKCQKRWFQDHHPEEFTLCTMQPPLTFCLYEGAIICQTGFANLVEKAYFIQNSVCSEGTYANKVVKNDPVCKIETLTNTTGCNDEISTYKKRKELVGLGNKLCYNLDKTVECMFRKFEVCTRDTQVVFRRVYESLAAAMKEVCKLMDEQQ